MSIFSIMDYDNTLHGSFVRATLYKHLQKSMDMNPVVFKEFADGYITHILATNKCLVMTSAEFPQLVYGFLIHSSHLGKPVIHGLYTKLDYRSKGIARILLDQITEQREIVFYTLPFRHQKSYLKNKFTFCIYNPLILTQDE